MIRPEQKLQKHRCPHYGFNGMIPKMYISSGGNQCGLITNSHSPCQMEMNKQTPYWNKCLLKKQTTKERLEEIANSQVFLSNKNRKPWDSERNEGISFQEHYKKEIGEDYSP